MKRILLPLVSLVGAALVLAAAAPAHIWTDVNGQTFSGELVSSNQAEVSIRAANGTVSRYARSLLSAKDLAYADQAGGAIPIDVKLDVSRVKFNASDDNSHEGQTITTEAWGYDIALTSKTMRAASNLRVEYQLYVRQAKLGEIISSQPLLNRPGSKTIGKLDAGGKISFKSDPVTTRLVKLKQGYYWTETGHSESVNDKLEGIWVRVFQGQTMIAEFTTNDTFKKAGWPVELKAAAAGK
ncbi:MAG: hypothetical protein WCL04_02215 [Verrucomicrobiota bacterium]